MPANPSLRCFQNKLEGGAGRGDLRGAGSPSEDKPGRSTAALGLAGPRERTGDPARTGPVTARPAPSAWRPGQSAAREAGSAPHACCRTDAEDQHPAREPAQSRFSPDSPRGQAPPPAPPAPPDSPRNAAWLPGNRAGERPRRGRGRAAAAPPGAPGAPGCRPPNPARQGPVITRPRPPSDPDAPHPWAPGHTWEHTWTPVLGASFRRPGDPTEQQTRQRWTRLRGHW